jgi:hypothetical protein
MRQDKQVFKKTKIKYKVIAVSCGLMQLFMYLFAIFQYKLGKITGIANMNNFKIIFTQLL